MPSYECTYCGAVAAATDDHIPAKTFFTGTLNTSLPSVKACHACNGGASLDDEYLRDTVLKYHRVADLPRAQALVEKMFRAIALPRKAAYARTTLGAFVTVDLTTPAGIALGKQPAFRVDQRRLERVVSRYVRGLHRYHFEERVPPDTPIRVVVNPDVVNQRFDEFAAGFANATVTTIQEGTFWYARMRPSSRPTASYWLLVFFDAFPMIAAFRPDEPLPPCAETS